MIWFGHDAKDRNEDSAASYKESTNEHPWREDIAQE